MDGTKCFFCNASISSQQIKNAISFSCNHIVCAQCLPGYLIKKNFSFLSGSTEQNNLNLICSCEHQGKVTISFENIITLLTSSYNENTINTNPNKCSKHNLQCDHFCKECNDSFCTLCMPNHENHKINDTPQCNVHSKEFSIFCITCNREICEDCVEEHKDHDFYDVPEIKKKISKVYNEITCKSYEEVSKFLTEKENCITEKINNEIYYSKNRIEQLIDILNQIKTSYISKLYDDVYHIGLLFKIFKIINQKFYFDLNQSYIHYEHQYKYLADVDREMTDIKVNFPSSSIIFDNVNEELNSLYKTPKISYNILTERLNTPAPKEKSAMKSKGTQAIFKSKNCEKTLKGHSWSVLYLLKLKDGKLASASSDKTIKIWDLFKAKDYEVPLCTIKAHSESVTSLMQLSNGNLVSCSKDKTISVWDISDYSQYKKLFTLKGHSNVVTSMVELSPQEIASCSFDTNIIIWDLTTKKEVQTFHEHSKYIYCMISIDNELIASSSFKEIKIWNVKTKKKEYDLFGHSGWIYTMTLVDKNKLASGSYDKSILVWDLEKREVILTLNGHSGAVQCLISIDKEMLCSGSWDKSIKFWEKGKEILTLTGHSNEVLCLCDLGSGKIASGSDDSLIKIWEIYE